MKLFLCAGHSESTFAGGTTNLCFELEATGGSTGAGSAALFVFDPDAVGGATSAGYGCDFERTGAGSDKRIFFVTFAGTDACS